MAAVQCGQVKNVRERTGKTFVGFGFGAIQSGLFLLEAYASGRFSRFVVAEIDADLVRSVRRNKGRCRVNIARPDRIDHLELEAVELYNPRDPADRREIVEAVGGSDEMATALPSVEFYDAGGELSVARMIGDGLTGRAARKVLPPGPPTIVYAAENHNQAAEFLAGHVAKYCPPQQSENLQVLNTVIGKMSGVITDGRTISRMGLETIAPDIPRAVLVEQFNRILISRITLGGYRRGIEVFVEKDDLLPFEEAKLYGHNAVHALIAYLADLKGLGTIAEAGRDRRIMDIARKAFIDESGAALVRRHAGLADPLFTPEGYLGYADDLLARMICPNLNDLVSRVGRDHVRKLGYDDRLYGTMRLALQYGVRPRNLALGAAAGVLSMIKRRPAVRPPVPHLPEHAGALTRPHLEKLLAGIWGSRTDEHRKGLIDLTWGAVEELR